MKRLKVVIIFAILFCAGCGTESDHNDAKGQLYFEIKSPQNFADGSYIQFSLHQPETSKEIEFRLTDISSDTMISIPEGEWEIKVAGFNSNMKKSKPNIYQFDLKYSLPLNKEIYLTDEDTVKILINWDIRKDWVDFENNPVIKPQNSNYDYGGIAQSNIIGPQGSYEMMYVGVTNNGVKYVLNAQSRDGNEWRHQAEKPLLSPGESGKWDSWAVHPGPVITINGIYHMYYTGFAALWGKWEIGLATSTDGKTWEKRSEPIISAGNGWGDKLIPWSIIRTGDQYYLYYVDRHDYDHPNICLAISTDGYDWKNYSGNPVLEAEHTWEENGIHYPSVIFDEGKYKMAYATIYSSALGWATSEDGINWKKSPQPFFTKYDDFQNWADEITYPFLIRIDDNLRCYYTGFEYRGDGTYTSSIGFAVLDKNKI